MNSQALAICFGPLFTCHSETESFAKPIQVFKFLLDIWPSHRRGKPCPSIVQELITISNNTLCAYFMKSTGSTSRQTSLESNVPRESGVGRSEGPSTAPSSIPTGKDGVLSIGYVVPPIYNLVHSCMLV